MRATILIEIAGGSPDDLPRALIEAAYRASAAARVLLVLPANARRHVDRCLDPIVQDVGPTTFGVQYVDASDQPVIAAALHASSCVVATTAELRDRCAALGIPTLDVSAAIASFGAEGAPAGAERAGHRPAKFGERFLAAG